MADRIARTVSTSTAQPVIGFRSRRGSLASTSSRGPAIDKEALSQALDEIHTTASRQETLTSFSDYDGSGPTPVAGPKELVSGGLAGLYSRFRQSVTGSPEAVRRLSSGNHSKLDTLSVNSGLSGLSGHLRSMVETDAKRSSSSHRGSRDLSERSSAPQSPRVEKEREDKQPVEFKLTSPSGRRRSGAAHILLAEAADIPADRSLPDHSQSPALSALDQRVETSANDLQRIIAAQRSSSESRRTQSKDRTDDSVSFDGQLGATVSLDFRTQTDKRASVQSKKSMGTPDSKAEARSSRLRLPGEKAQETVRPPLLVTESSNGTGDPSTISGVTLLRPLARVVEKGPPTVTLSRASSTADGADLKPRPSSASSSTATTPRVEFPPNLNVGFRRPNTRIVDSHKGHTIVPAHLKRRVVSKEFWMKDENARDCFYCGDTFSTFRRKHHCRTCGQIFDAKCTTLVSGRPFDLPGTLRLCRPCEGVIYGSDDDSTVFTDDEEDKRASMVMERPQSILKEPPAEDLQSFKPSGAAIATPSIGIPASRRNRESKRRSAVIEFDANPILARPGSSRSLKSLAGRPRSSSHRRHPSKHQHMKNIKHILEERGPFHQETGESESRQLLPAFHNDNIIDPDLAPFMSDEGSEDDHASIFTVLNAGSHPSSFIDNEQSNLSSLVHANSKKGRPRTQSDRIRDELTRLPARTGSKLRKRNPSMASINFVRPSPRRIRSQTLLYRDVHEAATRVDGSDIVSVHEVVTRENLDGKIKRSAAMHGDDAPKVELNRASLQHVRNLLAQLLRDNNVPRSKSWEKALLPILLQCTDDVDPDVQHGDDMDIRNYVKLKKVPGGKAGDTAYVSGVVFSKNVALKGMKRSFTQPRIVIVTFAIEYARHNTHFMSLDPILAQEREYLRNLVGRIVALRPQVLLVQRNVSGIALQMLNDAGITVIPSVKESVLAAVARVTKTIMIKTVDKLSIDPSHLGACENFDVKTYIHGGVKKTYIFISGCQPSLGCTIVLRGASTEVLRQVKRITEFMCYVVYNLKLETCLMRDEFVLIPSSSSEQNGIETMSTINYGQSAFENPSKRAPNSHSLVGEDDSSKIDNDTTERLADDQDSNGNDQGNSTSQYWDLVHSSQTRLMSSSPFVKFHEPYLLKQALEQEATVKSQRKLLATLQDLEHSQAQEHDIHGDDVHFEMIHPEMLQEANVDTMSTAMRRFLQDIYNVQYQRSILEYSYKKRQWESFFESSNHNPFDPFLHQNIFVLHSLVSSVTSAPCAGPEVIGLSFYADYEHEEMNYQDDCTLGQFVEDICVGAATACKTCGRKMLDHHRQYVHGFGQLTVSVTRHPSKIKGLQNSILMWSTCKICNQETTVIPMSDNSWKYSLGKYLELSFWSTPLRPRAGLCPHDIHKDFVRCFGFHDQCVRVQYDSVEIYEVVVPSPTINWAVHSDLALKNRLYSDCVNKLSAFISSIKARLESINLSTLSQDKIGDASSMLEKLMQRADHDHSELLNKIQAKYMSSRYYEFVPLNRAIRFMDEKAIAWDEAFGDFERNYFPSETDIRNLATLQLKKLFLDRGEVTVGDTCELDGMEMKDGNRLRRINLTDDILHSEKAQHMLNSVLEEQIKSGKPDESDLPTAASLRQQLSGGGDVRSTSMSHSEAEKIADREEVKHLDLAVVSVSPEHSPLTTHQFSPHSLMSPEHMDSMNAVADTERIPQPQPLNPTLVEKIEQIRAAATAAHSDDNEVDTKLASSKIPRYTDLQKKSGSQTQTPILARAHTQPNHVPRASVDRVESAEHEEEEVIAESDGEDVDDAQAESSKAAEMKVLERFSSGMPRPARTVSMIPRSIPSKQVNDTATRVSALAKHFEQLSREFEKERLRERRMRAARMRQSRASHLPSSQPVVEVFRDASEAVSSKPHEGRTDTQKRSTTKRTPSGHSYRGHTHVQSTSDISQEAADTTDAEQTDQLTDTERASYTYGHGTSDTDVDGEATDNDMLSEGRHSRLLETDTAGTSAALLSPTSIPDLELPLPKHEKSSLIKMLSSFWSERSASGWAPLEYPLNQAEHVFDDSDIVVREDEPSSVIALALSSNDYLKKLSEFRQGGQSRSRGPDRSTLDSEAIEQAAIEASLVSETGTHMKYSFGHNQVRAQCKIFYAESFDALRRKCGVSDRFVESLSRSIKWDSKGGKTKSLFLKTLDDRFVIKSLQEVELKAFTRFAPDYFAFMSQTLFHGVPSVIAKMFGLFQVMIKNPATGVEFSSYLLVMENLFYDHKPTRRFDLKGSMRNRKIESTGQPDEVLLDENLVETIFEKPLFVREHARKLVKASVWNDTMFLCRQNVMDYSLMAGFDDPSRRLFVGIIDCIRTYTWDKKLESWIKDRGKNKPTITSPKDYRNRFRVSMMQYVLQSPNVYHEFSRAAGVMPGAMRPTASNARPEASDAPFMTGGARQPESRDGLRGAVEDGLVDEVAMHEMISVGM
ncbi:hypothetical protein ANO11243_074890 [Dothideomycetidae sp. 11243]|nr:hypothetical protein ANO11243_074890 [fungal sp. No.11243]